MIKRLAAIAFIFACTAIAWAILGATLMQRTNSFSDRLRGRVQSIWGVPQNQSAPQLEYAIRVQTEEVVEENGRKKEIQKTRLDPHTLTPSSSDIRVALNLEHRQKGLLWYSTYKVDFRGDYEFTAPSAGDAIGFRLALKFPAEQAMYDGLEFQVNGRAAETHLDGGRVWASLPLAPGEKARLHVAYTSQGLESWRYSFGDKVNPVQNFRMEMTTNFKDIDFPDNTLSPSVKQSSGSGWQLAWNYRNLVSGYEIAMSMPEKLQPGPLASEISFFAPVSLFFFFFVLFILTTTRSIELHPMNYFFLAAAFFAFHLLLAYLVDHLELHWSFAIASAVSIFLVVTYLRLVAGVQFALREAALAQFLYLVLFSYAFFFKGYTGLAITIGAVVTLFVVMQMTAKVRWSEKFSRVSLPPPLPASGR